MRARSRSARPAARLGVLFLATMLAGVAGPLLGASTARAAPFTWSGQSTSANWSQANNWQGSAAPSGSVGTLGFPSLTGPACSASPQTGTCYQSVNDQSGLTTSGITIDDGAGYNITGSPITLGPGGITASPSVSDPAAPNDRFSTLGVPITLGAAQTWSITGGSPNQQLLLLGTVTGDPSYPLAITLQSSAGVTFTDAEVGNVVVYGDGGASAVAVKLGYFDNTGALVAGSLNATDGNPVALQNGAVLFGLDGTVGPLSATNSSVQVGQPDQAGTLTVDGNLTLDAQSALAPFINGSGTTAGSDFSELTTSGTVDLGDSTLALEDGEVPGSNACELLTPGDTDTLVTATGGLTGQFNGIPGGTTVPLLCRGSGGTPPTATINYTANTVTATIATPGTAGAATTTTLSAAPTSLVTNQPVTLTATLSSNAGTPAGTVEFYNDLSGNTTAIPGCRAQPVAAVQPVPPTGPVYTATCQTSFSASESPNLSAVFSPADGSDVAESTTSGFALSIAPAATSTALTLAPTTVGPGQPTTITATITPGQTGSAVPSGTVGFLVDGKPLPAGNGGSGCDGVTVVGAASSSTAECDLEIENISGTSTHTVTATYSADANFTASTSPAQTLTTVGPTSTPPKPSKICQSHVGRASVSVVMIDVVVTCKGTKGQRATLSLKLSAKEKSKAKAGKANKKNTKAKMTTRAVVVGTKTVTLNAGDGETVHVALNAAAIRALLKARKLPVTLTATQKTATGTARLATQQLTFASHCASTWAKLKICRSNAKTRGKSS